MSVSDRYANALCKVGIEKGVLDALEDAFTGLMEAYQEDEKFKRFFESPLINNKDKKELIDKSIGDKNRELNNLMKLLVDRHREKELPFIYESFMQKLREEKNRVLCTATTAYELGDEEREKLAKILKETTKKEVELKNMVDESIIGGIVIKVGDRVYDYSVKGQLGNLRETLLKTSLAKVG